MENLRKYINYKVNCINTQPNTFKNLFEIIHDQEDRIFCEEYNGYKVVSTTYKEYKEICIGVASYLKNTLSKLKPDSFVGLMMENNKYWIAYFWGLLMAGFKPMLLNVRLGNKLNQDIIDELNIKYIICEQQTELNVKHILSSDIDASKYPTCTDFTWGSEIALSTSATSLNIKICVYNAKEVFEQIKNTRSILNKNKMIKEHYKGRLKQLCFLPFYHIFGLFATYFWFSVFGRTFVFLHDYSSETILKTVRRLNVTHVFAVPMVWNTIYSAIIKEVNNKGEKTKKKFNKGINLSIKLQKAFPKLGMRFAKRAFKEVRQKIFGDSIKFTIAGGSYISSDVLKVINGIGYPLYNGYGMSEIGITSVELRENVKYRLLGSVGQPFDSVTYKINNNRLFVKGDSICNRIIAKEHVLEIKKEQYFSTNDIVEVDKNGYYYILGRGDDVVISSSGEKINPDLIEKEMFFTYGNHFSVLGLSKDETTKLSLIVEIPKDVATIRLNKIVKNVDENIEKLNKLNYHIEQVYFTKDAIAAKTAIKVSRSYLTRLINNGDVKLIPYSDLSLLKKTSVDDLSHEITEKVISVMAEVLLKNVDEINPDDHFMFDLGGSSLDYLTLLVKLHETFDIDFNFVNDDNCYNAIQFSNYIFRKEQL